MAKCKACGATLVWIKTTAGKSMPCNADAVEYQDNKKGTSTIVTKDGRVLRVNIVAKTSSPLQLIPDGVGYVPHWATCPAAKQFKGGRK